LPARRVATIVAATLLVATDFITITLTSVPTYRKTLRAGTTSWFEGLNSLSHIDKELQYVSDYSSTINVVVFPL
jgi:hypothetical protein